MHEISIEPICRHSFETEKLVIDYPPRLHNANKHPSGAEAYFAAAQILKDLTTNGEYCQVASLLAAIQAMKIRWGASNGT